jgi:AraC family transcriptional regulator
MAHDATRPEAHVDWIDRASGRHADLLAGRFQASVAGAWDGIRVLRGRLAPGEASDGHLANHVMCFDVGDAGWREYHWPGVARHSGAVPPLAINVLPAGAIYSARWRPGPETVLVELEPSFVASVASRGFGGAAARRPAAAVDDPFAAHLALALAEVARWGSPGAALAAEGVGVALAAHLLARGAGIRPGAQAQRPLAPARLRRVLDHIRERLDASLTLRELAGVADMNVYRFVRAFKEATGVPPHRYVMEARIERAKALLRDRALTISEVALQAGFATPSHFSTAFRRVTSATPRAFREASR